MGAASAQGKWGEKGRAQAPQDSRRLRPGIAQAPGQPGPDSKAKEAVTWSHGSKKQAGGNFFEPKISFLSRLHYPAPPLPPPPSPPKELKAWTSGGCAPKTRQL